MIGKVGLALGLGASFLIGIAPAGAQAIGDFVSG